MQFKDVLLYNNADSLVTLGQISTQLIITSNGNVTWLSTSILRSSCAINARFFPFDIQNCSLIFGKKKKKTFFSILIFRYY